MDKMIYEKNMDVTYYDLDYMGRMRLSSLTRLMNIAGDNHSKMMNVGYDDLKKKHLAFLLMKLGVKVYEFPKYNDVVTVRTWPLNPSGVSFVRNGDILDASGCRMLEWSCICALADLIKRKIVRPSALELYKFEIDPPEICIEAKKLIFPANESLDTSYTHIVTYRDVDLNMHLNNIVYFDIIMNSLPSDCISDIHIKEIQINYINEAGPGDEINVSYIKKGNEHFFKGYIGDTVCFIASLQHDK